MFINNKLGDTCGSLAKKRNKAKRNEILDVNKYLQFIKNFRVSAHLPNVVLCMLCHVS